jgi:hypothetical protein
MWKRSVADLILPLSFNRQLQLLAPGGDHL